MCDCTTCENYKPVIRKPKMLYPCGSVARLSIPDHYDGCELTIPLHGFRNGDYVFIVTSGLRGRGTHEHDYRVTKIDEDGFTEHGFGYVNHEELTIIFQASVIMDID